MNEKLRIITNGSGVFIAIAEIIQNGLGAIGVDSEIVNYDQATTFPSCMTPPCMTSAYCRRSPPA